MEEEGEDGGRWGKWRKRITRVFTGGKEKEKGKGREGSKGSVEDLPRIVVSQFSCKSRVFKCKIVEEIVSVTVFAFAQIAICIIR